MASLPLQEALHYINLVFFVGDITVSNIDILSTDDGDADFPSLESTENVVCRPA